MDIFLINIVVLLSVFFLHKVFFKQNIGLFCILIIVYLVLICGLRDGYTVGVDLNRYSVHYSNVTKMSLFDAFFYSDSSWAYYFLTSLFGKVGINFQLFIFLHSAFCISSVGVYIYKYSISPILSFFVYIGVGPYVFMHSGLRQAIAMAVILYSFSFYMKNKKKISYILVILAVMFHSSAVVIIPFYLVINFKVTKLLLSIYTIVLLAFAIFGTTLGKIVTFIFADEYMDHYVATGKMGGTAILCLFILMLFIFTNYKDVKENKKWENIMLHGVILTCLIQLLSAYAYAFTRLNYYYIQLIMVLAIPHSIKLSRLKEKTGKTGELFYIILFVVFCIVMSYTYIKVAELELPEYTFYWQ